MIYNLWPITMENRRGKNGAGVIYNGNSCCELMLISYGFESCFERAHFPFLLLSTCIFTLLLSIHSILLLSSVG